MNADFSGIYWLAGSCALGLFVYLLHALLRAEEVA